MQIENINFIANGRDLMGDLGDGRYIHVHGHFQTWKADLHRPGRFLASLRNKGNMRIRSFRSPEAAAKNAVKEWAAS